jgi:hypothetical protein
MRITARFGVTISSLSILAVAACAQNPFGGVDGFPQFRQISGLSGGGYGLDIDGWGSLGGATAFSTPLGIALGHDQVRVGGGDTAFSWKYFPKRFEDDSHGSGKAFFTYGHSFDDQFTLTYSYLVKSFKGDASTNLQMAYKPRGQDSISTSLGVQDLIGNGGSALNGPTQNDLSRSIFGAVTYKVPTGSTPVYVSAGYGSLRFDKGFANASYRVLYPVRLWAEYDGFGFNEGLLISYRSHERSEDSPATHAFEADLCLGVIRGRYPTAAITLGF